MPVDVLGVAEGRQRYGLFTNETGGILDDLMFANRGDHIFVVVNAACKAADIAHMQAHLSDAAEVIPVLDRGLLALQGPQAEAALARLVPGVAAMRFMDVAILPWQGVDLWIPARAIPARMGSRFRCRMPPCVTLPRLCWRSPKSCRSALARATACDSRPDCLYGHDIDTTTSPVEAGLTWAIQKVRRTGGARAGGFPARPACRTLQRSRAAACRPAPGRPRADA